MHRYQEKPKLQKEIQYSRVQKFLQFSLEAPSKQLNFMPHTYHQLPAYYQMTTQQLMQQKRNPDQTIEILDLVQSNQEKHEMDRFQQSIPIQEPSRLQVKQAISRPQQAGLSIVGNLSRMGEVQDPTLLSFQGKKLSMIGNGGAQNQTSLGVEESILNVLKMQEEVDKIYEKLIK